MISVQQVLDQIPALRRSARRLAGDRHDAEDLLQDSLIKCIKHRDKCDGVNVAGWCYVVMRNVLRSRKRKYEPITGYDMEYAAGSSPANQEDSVYVEQLLDKIGQLPKVSQSVLYEWVGGLDLNQISDKLCLELGTVKSRIARARERLPR